MGRGGGGGGGGDGGATAAAAGGGGCVVLNHITRGFRRSSWLLSSGESCGSRLRLRSWSALILVQGVRHQRAKVTVLTGRRDYLRACAAGPRDTICGAVVELDMI